MHDSLYFSQSKINQGLTCPYCCYPSELFVGKYASYYVCSSCDASVRCHKGTAVATGRLVSKELRELRELAHTYFDALWRVKVNRGYTEEDAKATGYQWVSSSLGIPIEWCHIEVMNEEQCYQVINLCKPYYERIYINQ